MLTKLKALFKNVLFPTVIFIMIGWLIDKVIQASAAFWFGFPIIAHPFPYGYFFYFVLGLVSIVVVYKSEGK